MRSEAFRYILWQNLTTKGKATVVLEETITDIRWLLSRYRNTTCKIYIKLEAPSQATVHASMVIAGERNIEPHIFVPASPTCVLNILQKRGKGSWCPTTIINTLLPQKNKIWYCVPCLSQVLKHKIQKKSLIWPQNSIIVNELFETNDLFT